MVKHLKKILVVSVLAAVLSAYFGQTRRPTQQDINDKKLVLIKPGDLHPNLALTKDDIPVRQMQAPLPELPLLPKAPAVIRYAPSDNNLAERSASAPVPITSMTPLNKNTPTKAISSKKDISSEWSRTQACKVHQAQTILRGLSGPDADRHWASLVAQCGAYNYVVRRGDTLPKISEQIFGDERYWTKIWASNPIITQPYDLQPGEKIVLYNRNMTPPLNHINYYEVQPDDENLSISGIAARLGSAGWTDSLKRQNNNIKNWSHLLPGQQIRIDTDLLEDN